MPDEPIRVLLIEDQPTDARLIRDMLARASCARFELTCADRLSSAIESFSDGPVDVLLLDLSLPDCQGLDALARVIDRAPHLPIVVLANVDDQDMAIEALQRGAQEYLVKGKMETSLLARSLSLAIHRKRSEDQLRSLNAELERRVAERTGQLEATISHLKQQSDQRVRAEDNLRLLSEASKMLASSLDYETTLQSVARLVVPQMADACILYLATDEVPRRAVVAHVDPSKEELLKEIWLRYPPDPDGPHPIMVALRAGQSRLHSQITEAFQQTIARDAQHLQMLLRVGFRSTMVVPLLARGRPLGVISFALSESDRRYGPADLRLAEELASRCALALDNAQLYREAQEAIHLREEFLSLAAHELKTPITSLRGFAQLIVRQIDRGELDPRLVRRALQVIDQQSGKLSRLVSQLLDISRLESGHLVLERRLTDIVDLVEDVVERARSSTNQHEIAVCTPRKVLAMVDALRLEQVVTNLLDNAIKYSPGGGRIDVEVSQPCVQTVCLAVRDRGIGVPPQYTEQIFARFYRAHKGLNFGGLGLGLYISRQIVELHGGHIQVDLPADGGTCFTVTLPTGLDPAQVHQEKMVQTEKP